MTSGIMKMPRGSYCLVWDRKQGKEYMKTIISIIALTLTLLSWRCSGENVWWTGERDNNWFNYYNYSSRAVPTTTTGVNFSLSRVNCHTTIIIDSGSAECYSLWSYNEYDNVSEMIVKGGSLTVQSQLILGSGSKYGETQMVVEGGSIVCDRLTVGKNIYSGAGNGHLIVNSSSASITTRVLELNISDANGYVKLLDGVINVGTGSLLMCSGHLLDVYNGSVIIDGDKTTAVNGYVSAGYITGFGGSGTVEVDYNTKNPGKTTITAYCDAAWGPAPEDAVNCVKPYADLSWQPGDQASALGYNIYFGTDYNSVNNASDPNVLPGRGNTTATSYDPGTLTEQQTYYWRIDEVTSGGTVRGQVWSFTVSSSCVPDYQTAFEISVGDNHYVATWLPVESQAGIDASFDLMKDVFNAGRIYWRGLQESQWDEEEILQFGSYPNTLYGFFPWVSYLLQQNTNEYAVTAAHARNMEIWGEGTIMDWGSDPASNAVRVFPFSHEAEFRKLHPEWIPVDKYGRRKQGGAIEMAYPEAREYLVDLIVDLALNTGYDGVILIMYSENYSMRFQDEFGFSQPIVDEFQSRYNVDIRTEAFDRQDWYDLRGEYFTQFLRELKAGLSLYNIKLGINMNGSDPSVPCVWTIGGSNLSTAGMITMDYQTWINERIIDMLQVSMKGTESERIQTIQTLQSAVSGTNVELGFELFNMYDGDIESFQQAGFETVGQQGEIDDYLFQGTLPFQDISVLTSNDATVYEKMRVLVQIVWHQTSATYNDVAPFLTHSNPLVKRLALRALAAIGGANSLTAIHNALFDSEIAVRHGAITALYRLSDENTAAQIISAVNQYGEHSFNSQAVNALLNCNKPTYTANKLYMASTMLNHTNPQVREVCARTLSIIGSYLIIDSLIQAMGDTSPSVRFYAVEGLNSSASKDSTTAVDALITALKNTSDVNLSNRAAIALGDLYAMGCSATAARKTEIITELTAIYQQKTASGYYSATDAEWAFRPLGMALLNFGQDGLNVLNSLMAQTTDMETARKAWYSVYIPMPEAAFNLTTESASDTAHSYYPAAPTLNTWWYGSMDDNWYNKDNYSGGIVPHEGVGVNWSISGVGTIRKLVIPGGKARCRTIWSYNEYDSTSEMIMQAGSLQVESVITIGSGSPLGNSILTVDGGDITCDRLVVGRNFGSGAGTGYLVVNSTSTTISTRSLEMNNTGAKGEITLNKGIIEVGSGGLVMTADHLIDIHDGKIIIDGDQTSTINGYISSGYIIGKGGISTVAVDYNTTTPGKTTVRSYYNTWWYGSADNDWFNAGNYSINAVPDSTAGINWSISGVGTTRKLIVDGGEAHCRALWSYNEYDSVSEMIMQSGTLEVEYSIIIGSGSPLGNSILTVDGGDITCDSIMVGRNFNGSADGVGYLVVNSSSTVISTRQLDMNQSGADGIITLNDGLIEVGTGGLAMESSHSIDIHAGTIILSGDQTALISGYINSGYIIAYGGAGTVNVDYNITTPGKTTVTGVQ